jgi:hypothetical protein
MLNIVGCRRVHRSAVIELDEQHVLAVGRAVVESQGPSRLSVLPRVAIHGPPRWSAELHAQIALRPSEDLVAPHECSSETPQARAMRGRIAGLASVEPRSTFERRLAIVAVWCEHDRCRRNGDQDEGRRDDEALEPTRHGVELALDPAVLRSQHAGPPRRQRTYEPPYSRKVASTLGRPGKGPQAAGGADGPDEPLGWSGVMDSPRADAIAGRPLPRARACRAMR